MIFSSAEKFCLSLLNTNKCNSLKALTQIHAFAFKTSLDQCPLIAGKLLLRCAVVISDGLGHARRLLSHFPNPDSFMHNTLLRGFSDSDDPLQALSIFREIHCRDSSLFDSFTFAFAVKAAANSRAFSAGWALHCRALVHGLNTHVFVGTTLVSFYAECGDLKSARKAFDEMPEPNVVSWNAILTALFKCGNVAGGEGAFQLMPAKDSTSWNVLLAGYLSSGELNRAKRAFSAMPAKDVVAWSTMIVGFAQNGSYHDALGFFRGLRRSGLAPNEASLTGALSASAQSGWVRLAKALHSLILKLGSSWMVSVNNGLLDSYSKCGHVDMARSVFESIPVANRTVVSWSSMVSALAAHGRGDEAVRVFEEMESRGISPDGAAFVSILSACGHEGLVEAGVRYFSRMVGAGVEPGPEHYGCLVDMYCRAGEVERGYEVACRMRAPANDVIWRTVLGACSLHGEVGLAERVKERLDRVVGPTDSGDRVLLSNAYAVGRKWGDASEARGSVGKVPGWSAVESVYKQD